MQISRNQLVAYAAVFTLAYMAVFMVNKRLNSSIFVVSLFIKYIIWLMHYDLSGILGRRETQNRTHCKGKGEICT